MLKEMTAQGCAVVISGHETDWVFRAAAHLVWVHQGTTRQLGSPAQARSDWRFRTEYLGTATRSGSR
jgi:ABC-type branched-subunit amino acid transport system ATPase component